MYRLVALNELPVGAVRACEVPLDIGVRRLILVRLADRVAAYLNSCPHLGVPLDWQPGILLDVSGEYLQCALHGALFRRDDGHCVDGPCRGARLRAVPVHIIADEVLVEDPARVPASAVDR
jgi:nitrite reductase/ring-hydroxylating ferredoxin subunit